MTLLTNNTEITRRRLMLSAAFFFIALTIYCIPVAHASAASEAITGFVNIVKLLSIVSGAIYLVGGLFAWAQGHGEDNGASQSKGHKQISTGITLLSIGAIVLNIIHPENWIASIS